MPLFGSSRSQPAIGTNTATLTNPSKVQFPMTFNAYHPKTLSSKIVLGTSDKNPVYVADFPSSGMGDIIMYDGPSDRGGTLAICKPHGMSRSGTIFIPPMGTSNQPIQEELRAERKFLKEAYSFAVAVGHGANARPEKFQWKSNGMKSYKLTRLSSRSEETVAEWSYDALGGMRSKVATFSFVGSGATGEMGDAWALMAVITMLRTLQVHLQTAMGMGIASAS